MPEHGFGRCDGHHEMVDLRRRKKRRSGTSHLQAPLHGLGTLRPSSGAADVLLGVVLRAFQLFGASANGS